MVTGADWRAALHLAWRREGHWWLAVAATCVAAFFLRLGAYPLFDLDEGAFSQATREMIASGNYLATSLDGEPRYDKPIFSYWMQALSVHLFGPVEYAFRLPSALAAAAWVGAVFVFLRQRLDVATAGIAALLLCLSLGPFMIGRAATADAWLNLWLALTFIEIARWRDAPRTATLLRAWLWMALGFLTKGPVAVVVPAAASLICLLWDGRGRDWLRAAFDPRGWLVFAAVALPWYGMILWQEGPGFFYGFFVEHNLQRFLETREGHGGSVLYYLWALPLMLSPFAGWLLAVLPRCWRGPQGLERLCWVWLGVVFVIFSFSGTQLPHYILYGVTPLLVVMALHREQLRNIWLAFVPALLPFVLLLLVPEFLRLGLGLVDRAYETALIERGLDVFGPAYRAAVALFAVAALGVTLVSRWPVWRRLLVIGGLQAAVLVTVFVPALAETQQTPVKRAAEIARDSQRPVVATGIHMPTFSVYRGQATPRRMPEAGEVAVTREHVVARIQARHDDRELDILYREGGIVLLAVPVAP